MGYVCPYVGKVRQVPQKNEKSTLKTGQKSICIIIYFNIIKLSKKRWVFRGALNIDGHITDFVERFVPDFYDISIYRFVLFNMKQFGFS